MLHFQIRVFARQEDSETVTILTNREEEHDNNKYPKASPAPIKVIKFCGISARMEH